MPDPDPDAHAHPDPDPNGSADAHANGRGGGRHWPADRHPAADRRAPTGGTPNGSSLAIALLAIGGLLATILLLPRPPRQRLAAAARPPFTFGRPQRRSEKPGPSVPASPNPQVVAGGRRDRPFTAPVRLRGVSPRVV